MKYTICYFSGTGNSLWSAKRLSSILRDARIVDISDVSDFKSYEITTEYCIFIYPAYAYEMPLMMQRFIRFVTIKSSYIAALVTYGSSYGGCLGEARRLLRRRGICLSYAKGIPCVENFIPLFGKQSEKKIIKRTALQSQTTEKIADDIYNRRTNKVRAVWPLSKLVSLLFRGVRPIFPRLHKVNDKCNGCLLCSRVCPAKCISLKEDGKPRFGKTCEQCQACLNICPQNAIKLFRRTPKIPQYIHPEISVRELCRGKSEEPAQERISAASK